LEAATHSLIVYLLINQILLANGGYCVMISPGLARLGSLAMIILGWCGGVSWQLASCHLLTSDPEIVD
jgi:hypothetical protein